MNNLKDVSVEIPKRRLTVFTGVSGSGKSSLVFGTIAAESQRMINETYSAFVQGFMPTLARPDVDVLDGLTTAIIVDQERMGANPRSTVGTATDANAMLRILFSRLGAAAHRLAAGVLVQRRLGPTASGGDHGRAAASKTTTEKATFNRLGGMCPRCEGMGAVTDFDLSALYDDSQVAQRGRAHDPRLQHGRLVRAHLPRLRLLRPGQADQRSSPRRSCTTSSTRSRRRSRSTGINLTYAGLIPQIQKSMLSKDVDAMQPHIRAFVERAVTFTTCPDCDGTRLSEAARSSKIDGVNIADACAMQISDLADVGRAASTSRRSRRCSPRCSTRSTRSSRSGSATSRSTGRRARSRAARRSARR